MATEPQSEAETEPELHASLGTAEARDVTEVVELPTGERLSCHDATGVLRAHESRVVAFVGNTGAGKTSLIASVYDLFQSGRCNDLAFAWSDTLPAFERACHYARAASEAETPFTEHTAVGPQVSFYHLAVLFQSVRRDFLLGDRSGEDYSVLGSQPGLALTFPELARADSIVILVDGARLLDPRSRHNTKTEALLLLQALHDSGVANRGQQVILTLTKLDEVTASPNSARVRADFASLLASCTTIFGESFFRIESQEVAAMPAPDTGYSRGHGVAQLLALMLHDGSMQPVALPPSTRPASRAFLLLEPQ